MGANDTQVGGAHYKSTYEHWDLVIKIPLSYLEGTCTKYVTRWRKKSGVQDLRKAMHYLDKLIEVGDYRVKRSLIDIDNEVERFASANNLSFLEYQFLFIICTYHEEKDLRNARRILVLIMNQAEDPNILLAQELSAPGTPDDGGHHADQE